MNDAGCVISPHPKLKRDELGKSGVDLDFGEFISIFHSKKVDLTIFRGGITFFLDKGN